MQKLLYGVGASIALLIIIGLALPRNHRVEVATEIDAHPATVFALLNDFRRHSLWSPLVDTDPNARILFSGSEKGVGATMTWDGAIIGSGIQTIVESEPYNHIGIVMSP
ncbi:MAG: polyketide cyclase, partial [Woeseiaceae bacterium]